METGTKEVVLAFDLYGTLLSTESIANRLGGMYGDDRGGQLATRWRVLQLEYTWRLNSALVYEPFSTVTLKALQQTLTESNVAFSSKQTDELMHAYDGLDTFPDVTPALTAVSQAPNVSAVVFSNGTHAMVAKSVQSSASLSPHASVFRDLITVDEPQRFKPDPSVYRHLARKMGKAEEQMGDLWLVSGNPFDIVGARNVGMKAVWVDRAGGGWVDKLGDGPNAIIKTLTEVVETVRKAAT